MEGRTVLRLVLREIYKKRCSKKGIAGCEKNLLIDRCICNDTAFHKCSLSIAWIHYQKAFNSTSQRLLICLLKSFRVHADILGCIQRPMPLWNTRFTTVSGKHGVTTTLQRRIFQCNNMNPLLFLRTLLSLNLTLHNSHGYSTVNLHIKSRKLTHLFYMIDVKIYAKNPQQLNLATTIIEKYTGKIKM